MRPRATPARCSARSPAEPEDATHTSSHTHACFSSWRGAEKAQQEVEVLSGLDHPGIVRYHEHFVHEDQLCVVMHYCEGGDLSQHIKQRAKVEKHFEEHEAIDLFVQIVMARRAARTPRRAHAARREGWTEHSERTRGGLVPCAVRDSGARP